MPVSKDARDTFWSLVELHLARGAAPEQSLGRALRDTIEIYDIKALSLSGGAGSQESLSSLPAAHEDGDQDE